MTAHRRIALMVTSGLIISVIIGINAHQTIRQLIEMNKWLVHTHLTVNKTQRVLAILHNLDNDLRGYLLSQNGFFKADFDQNTQQMVGHLSRLKTLTSDNPSQQKRIQTLNALFHKKMMLSEALFKQGGIVKGTARLDSIKIYLTLSDRFSQVLTEAERHENILLDQRTAQNERSAQYATWSNLVGAVTAFAMIMWAIYLLFQALRTSTSLNKQLTDSERQTKKLLEAVPVSIVIVDRQGKFYYANEAAKKMFGNISQFDSYTDVLESIQLFRYTDGKPYPLEERPTYKALQGQVVQTDDLETRVDGRAVQLFCSSSPVYEESGELQYVISSIIDISDRVQSQNRLQEAKEIAEKAAKVKENFLANMSHEIRTPLNAILGFSDLLSTTTLDSDQQEFVGFVRTAGKNLLTIVNDILDISKIEAGMIRLESIPFSIYLLTASIKTMLQPSAVDKNLYLRIETDPDIPPVLLGDPTRLTQILLNLLSNATKFTKRGGVILRVEKEEQSAETVRIRFLVEDTGIGIEPSVLPTIFERFQQASDFTTRFYGGTGLGLNIVKSLAELQGGSVSVSSTVNTGSVFTVEITYKIAEPQPTNLTKAQESPNAIADDRQVCILVVEDNHINQKLILQVIKRLGYHVDLADNGQKAIDSLLSKSYDIVLMDIQMPIMDGYETTRQIRNQLQSSVPIIAMTAHALASEREECLKAGMNDFLSKPFQVDDLQRLIKKYLASKNSEEEFNADRETLVDTSDDFFINSLLQTTGNDMELAVELLHMYINQVPREIEEIQQALKQKDINTVSRLIHTHKVHTKMLSMDEATRLIIQAEMLIKSNHDFDELVATVEKYILQVFQILPKLVLFLENTEKKVA
ncbi:response regulator [Spirosoma pomorum]